MRKSTLKEHQQFKTALITPFNKTLGKLVTFNSWHQRLPNLLWLALIINKYGHKVGLEKCYRIISFMKENNIEIENLNISNILKLDEKEKSMLFNYINEICEDKILDCLCLVIDDKIFRNKFYITSKISEERIKELRELVTKCYDKYSYLGCDIRFLYIYFFAIVGKMVISKDCPHTIEAFSEYHKLEHNEPIMEWHRSSIRASEMAISSMNDTEYPKMFWSIVGNISECELYLVDFPKGDEKVMKEFYVDIESELNNLISNNFENKNDDKFIVISGLFAYATKILKDVCEHNLHNSITSRILFRTIIDIYITIKYLLLLERDNNNVWKEYQEYGLGKFKLIYKKAIEKYKVKEESHLAPKYLEILVNENIDDETMDIDLGYFDKTSIIAKFESVGEKELYDTLYDYDVSYAHAHWGAIRESSVLKCDNTLHQLHVVADENNQQNTKSTDFDYIKLFVKLLKVISTEFKGISDDFLNKYEV